MTDASDEGKLEGLLGKMASKLELARSLAQGLQTPEEEGRGILMRLEAVRSLLRTLDPLEHSIPALDRVLLLGRTVMEAGESSFLLFDREAGKLRFLVTNGPFANFIRGQEIPVEGTFLGQVANSGEGGISDSQDHSLEALTQKPIQDVLGAPVLVGREVVGVVSVVGKRKQGKFTDKDLVTCEYVAFACGEILARHFQKGALDAVLDTPDGPLQDVAVPETFRVQIDHVNRLSLKIGTLLRLHPERADLLEDLLDALVGMGTSAEASAELGTT